jgi:O-antigen ligase
MLVNSINMRTPFFVYCVAGCVALLCVNPLALGPSTAVWPNLFGLLAVGLICGAAALSRHVLPLALGSRAAPWLAALAVYAWVHSALLIGMTPMNGLFVLTAVLMFALGAVLQWLPAGATAAALAWGVFVGAMVNVAIGWGQFTGHAAAFSPWVNQLAADGQIYGNVRQPNQYATLMAMGLAGLWWLCLSMQQARPRVSLWTSVLAAALLMSGIVLSGSRTGVLEVALLAAAAWCWRGASKSRQRSTALLFMALPLLYMAEWALLRLTTLVLGVQSADGLVRFADATGSARNLLYRNVMELIAANPVAGYGIHELNFHHFDADFSRIDGWLHQGRFPALLDNAHNVLLHSWVELGLLGMLLSVGALALGTLRAKPWREANTEAQMAWLVIAVLALHSMLEYPLHYAQFWLPFCLALCVAFSKHTDTSDNIPSISLNIKRNSINNTGCIRIFALLFSFCTVAFFYAAWDFDRVSQAFNGAHKREVPLGVSRIDEAQKSLLFAPYARFAKAMVTEVDASNAAQLLPELQALLHFSAEPRLIEKLLKALSLAAPYSPNKLLLEAEAAALEKRYAIAFPADYQQYLARH